MSNYIHSEINNEYELLDYKCLYCGINCKRIKRYCPIYKYADFDFETIDWITIGENEGWLFQVKREEGGSLQWREMRIVEENL